MLFREVTDFLDDVSRTRADRRRVEQVHDMMEEQETQDIHMQLDQGEDDDEQYLTDSDSVSDIDDLVLLDIDEMLGSDEEEGQEAAAARLVPKQPGLFVQPCSLLCSFDAEASSSAASQESGSDAVPLSRELSENGMAMLLCGG